MESAYAIHGMTPSHTMSTLFFIITKLIMETMSHSPTMKENATQNPSLNNKQCNIDCIPKMLSLKSSRHSHPMVVAPFKEMVLPLYTFTNKNPEIKIYM